MMSLRDPYPFPKLQNDENFAGLRQTLQEPYGVPTHLAQKQDPWNRLNTKHTLSSTRREVQHYDPVAPQDSLDFVLKSEYDHHGEFLKDKNETLLQPETLGREHGRVLKNRTVVVVPQAPTMDHPISISEQTKRESIHCIKNAIAREDMIRYHVTPAASLWPSLDEESDCRPQAASPTPSPNPLSVFTPFWARSDHGETLPAPVTITYVDHYPAPSDDDSDYWVYEDEDDDSFVEDREVHPLRKALRRVAAFWRRIFS